MNASTSLPIFVAGILGILAVVPEAYSEEPLTGHEHWVSEEDQILGGKAGAQLGGTWDAGKSLLRFQMIRKFLDTPKALLRWDQRWNIPDPMDLTQDPGDEENEYAVLYVGGMRVLAPELRYDEGAYILDMRIPPARQNLPLVAYPVGPLVLRIDTGIQYVLGLQARATPRVSYPLPNSQLELTAGTQTAFSGYLQGSARLLIVRAGLEGRVDVVDADTQVGGRLSLAQPHQPLKWWGTARFLSGGVTAFIDYFRIFRWRWKRFWDETLVRWNGVCKSWGDGRCDATDDLEQLE